MDIIRCVTINHADGPIRGADGVATERNEGPLVKVCVVCTACVAPICYCFRCMMEIP